MSASSQQTGRRQEEIRLILKDLLKVIKVVSLYPETNPMPQSLRRSFAERLVDVVNDFAPIEIKVDKERLLLDQETVFVDRSREESLAAMLFEVGIIGFTFKPDLDDAEVERLIDVFKVYQNSNRHTTDLVALLWEAGLEHFSFETAEDVSLRGYVGDFRTQEFGDRQLSDTDPAQLSGERLEQYQVLFDENEQAASDVSREPVYEVASLGEPAEDGAEVISGSVLDVGDESANQQFKVGEAVEAMGLGDLTGQAPRIPDLKVILSDSHKLSEEETERVNTLVAHDAEFDIWESAADMLKEILHQEADMSDFFETVTICEKVVGEMVQAGRLSHASDAVRYFRTLEDEVRQKRPLWAERLKDARVTAGGRERMHLLCRALNENEETGAVEVQRYLDNFTWESLVNITDLLGELKHRHHVEAVRNFLSVRGKDNVLIMARGLRDKRPEVVAATVTILGQVGDSESLRQLRGVVEHPELNVRIALVNVLSETPADDALELLCALAYDPDAEIRSRAVRAISGRRGPAAFETIADILDDKRFAELNGDDQQALFNAYSALGGDAAVEYLVSLVERKGLFKGGDTACYRLAALEALSRNRSERAEKALLRMAGSWRREIREGAREALRRRRELIYGGDDDCAG